MGGVFIDNDLRLRVKDSSCQGSVEARWSTDEWIPSMGSSGRVVGRERLAGLVVG